MKFLHLLIIVPFLGLALSAVAQNRKGKGLRKQSAEQGNYRVAVLEIPEDTASKFERLMLYQPVKTSQEKLPLVVTLHGSGGGRRDIE